VDARRFREARASTVSPTTKLASLQALLPVLDRPMISSHDLFFRDVYSQRRFRSSNGADVLRDHQLVGIAAGFSVKHEDETFREHYITGACTLDAMQVSQEQLLQRIEKAERFVSEAEPVEPGDYPVILSPLVAGGFAHESFGHKSEADFMTDDPSMLEAWKLGMQVGSDILSIVDDGGIEGAGFTAYDDEGQPAHKTWLVREGKLAGRLHSTQTAAILQEQTTGNARATTFEFPPIVRMTNTYIDAGTTKLGALFGSVKRGLFVETFKHGSGMSTFTIAPSMAWWVEDGEITKPARFSVLTGSVFETLGHIRAVSDEVELMHTPFGGCGKFNQFPLPVSFGGPHVLIDPMHVA
jgi:TldD protein